MNFKTFTSDPRSLSLTLLLLMSTAFAPTLFGQSPAPQPVTYPRMAAYQGILHPIVTFDKDGTQTNFRDYYVVGFPMGINLWKTKKLGFSFELVPTIRAEHGNSRVSNVVFHPGVLVNLGRDFTFAGRMAFETSGRYGVTPVFNKIVKKGVTNSYFVAVPIPVRFGNNHPASLTLGIQFGIVF